MDFWNQWSAAGWTLEHPSTKRARHGHGSKRRESERACRKPVRIGYALLSFVFCGMREKDGIQRLRRLVESQTKR